MQMMLKVAHRERQKIIGSVLSLHFDNYYLIIILESIWILQIN